MCATSKRYPTEFRERAARLVADQQGQGLSKWKVSEANAGFGRYVTFYNTRRAHSALCRRTQDGVYFKSLPPAAAA